MLVEFLQQRGYLPDLAADGEVGLAKLKNDAGKIDLIITDNQLPKSSGLTLVEQGRASGYSKPIIVYSSCLTSEIQARYERLGVKAFVEKGNGLAGLMNAIAQAIAGE
jgi:DNA-binding response OmpR family regulator